MAERAGARGIWSLRVKVGAAVAGPIAVLALFLLAFSFFRSNEQGEKWMERRAFGVASALALAVAPALDFDDARGVESAFEGLKNMPDVVFAAVLREDGSVLGAYREGQLPDRKGRPAPTVRRFRFTQDRLDVALPIEAIGGTRGALLIGFTLDELKADRASEQTVLSIVALSVLLLGSLLGVLLGNLLARPLLRLASLSRDVTSRRDLTVSFETASARDESGLVAESFSELVRRLREVLLGVQTLVLGLKSASGDLERTGTQVSSGATTALDRAEETLALMARAQTGLEQVGRTAGALSEGAQHSAATIGTMTSINEDVARSAETMAVACEQSTRAVAQTADSVLRSEARIREVHDALAAISASAARLDGAIQEIEKSADDTLALYENVSRHASVGAERLGATVDGVRRIQSSAGLTASHLGALGERVGRIGTIVDVIGDVADRTQLLSLNAAILSAQAGTHGEAFNVVAREIRDLAVQTRASAQEITDLVESIQRSTQQTARAFQEEIQLVEEGARLGKEALSEFDGILGTIRTATARSRAIATAVGEQTRESERLRGSVEQVASATRDLSSLAEEQSRAGQELLSLSKRLQSLVEDVHRRTEEQAQGSRHIAETTERVRAGATELRAAHDEQSRSSMQVLRAIEDIRKVARSQHESARSLEAVIGELRAQAERLEEELGEFRI